MMKRNKRHNHGRKSWTERFGLNVLRQRWTNTMPKFFRWVCYISAFVGGTALAVNTAIVAGGGTTHEWWNDIYPYLLGVPAGAAFVAKFTQNYDREGNPIKKGVEPDTKERYYDSDVVVRQPGDYEVSEIEPYNDGPRA